MGQLLHKNNPVQTPSADRNYPEEWTRIDYVFRCLSTREVKIMMRHQNLSPTTVTNIGNNDIPIIFYCILNSRVKILKCLVEELNADLDFQFKGETALTTAIINNCAERFQYLINVPRININQITKTKSCAILKAALPGKENLFRQLVEKNVNLDIIGKQKDKSIYSREAIEYWFKNRVIKVRLFLFWDPYQKRSKISKKLPKNLMREVAEYI